MSTFGSLTSAGDVGASALRTAAELADEAVSANTRRTYENAWRVWATWCSDHGASGLCDRPADREPYVAALILFLSERVNAGVRPPSTAGQVVHAIRYAARRANSVETLAALSHPPQLQVRLRGLARRDAQTARKQAEPPLTLDLLGSLYRQAASERTARGIRDAALIATGIGAALRASSIGNLQVGDVAQAQTIDGLVLHLRTSKTDQTGRGSYIPIKRAIDDASRHLDPVTKLLAWRRHLTAAGASSTARCSRGSAETTASRATGSRTRTRRSRTCSGTGSDASASTTRSPQASPRTASEQPSSRSPQPPGASELDIAKITGHTSLQPSASTGGSRSNESLRRRTSPAPARSSQRPVGALQSRRDAPNLAAPNNASPKVGIPSTTRSARA